MVYRSLKDRDEGDLMTGTRVCRRCDVRQPMADYHWANGRKYRSRVCKGCWLIRDKARRASHPDPVARKLAAFERHLRVTYGMNLADYEGLMAEQGNACAICLTDISRDNAHVDHNHASGKVRGLLCFLCNTALGKFRDDPAILRAAIAYVERPTPAIPQRPRYLTPVEAGARRSAARLRSSWQPRRERGERNPASKLSDAQAEEIRSRYAAGLVTQQTLADEYGITQSGVSAICRRKVRPMAEATA